MNIPSGGKLLSIDQSRRFSSLRPADREAMIADIVSGMQVRQVAIDKRAMLFREHFGSVQKEQRRQARIAELRRELAELEGRP